LSLIANGVDLSELDAATQRPPHKAENAPHTVGYVGQLIPRKGLRTLLHAIAKLVTRGVELVIVGEGPQRAELESLSTELGIAPRVRFLGFRDDRVTIMQGFDLFVLPSELEGIPRCLMESMALGIPIIGTDIPGCRALIEPAVTGELFPVGDDRALALVIDRLLTNAAQRRALATKARARVRAEFSAATMSRRYVSLYRQLIGGQSAVGVNT
jgi:glycosyltransferase involved in cell wall biosynthesis